MADKSSTDDRAITLLVQQGLITDSQAKRLRTAVKRGMALGEAVVKTPMVDPVKLITIQSMVAQNLPVAPPQEPAKPPLAPDPDMDLEVDLIDDREPLKIGNDEFRIKNRGPVGSVSDDLDLDFDDEANMETVGPASPIRPKLPSIDLAEAPTLSKGEIDDLADSDFEFPDPEPLAAEEREQFKEQVDSLLDEAFDTKSKPRIVKPSHGTPAPPMPSYVSPRLEPLADKESYREGKRQIQTFDLADDEGINLIRQVNEIFERAINGNASAFQLVADAVPQNLRMFDANGRISSEDSIDADSIEKVVNRIKVMARIEVWRRLPVQKGFLRLIHAGTSWECFLKSETEAERKEVVTVYLERA